MQRRQLLLGVSAVFAAGCAHRAVSASAAPPPADPPPAQAPQISVIFAAATESDVVVPPEMQSALARLASVLSAKLGRPARTTALLDTESGRFDAAAGRALIDSVNERYGLALAYDASPYLLVLPQPIEGAASGDAMLAASFAGQSADQVLQSLTAIIAATEAAETRRLSFSAIIEYYKQTWAQISPVHTQTGHPVTSAQPHP